MHNKNIFDAFKNAFYGIIYNIKTQKNIRIQFLILISSLIFGILFKLSKIELLCLISAAMLIIIVEMINTGIETTVDLFCDVYHKKAKTAKDVGAGATLMAAINYIIICFFLFFDKVLFLITNILQGGK